jgi:hypothetical protein
MSAPETSSEIFHTRTARIYMGADGIVRMKLLRDVQIMWQDAVENLAAIERLCGDQKRPCLGDIRAVGSADMHSRQYVTDPKHARYLAVMAILADSPFTQTLVNMILRVNRPPFPARMFTREAEAIAWLQKYL